MPHMPPAQDMRAFSTRRPPPRARPHLPSQEHRRPVRKSDPVERDVREFLAANYFLGDDPGALTGSASLIEAGLIDSTGVLELVGFLEERFDIRITNEELLPENLDSIDNIVAFVTRKRETREVA